MEIDLPNKPIHSVKDFFVHISRLVLSGMTSGGPGNMSEQELQNDKQEIKRTMSGLFVLQQLESHLSKRYAEILSKYSSSK